MIVLSWSEKDAATATGLPRIIGSIVNCKETTQFNSEVALLKNENFTWNSKLKVWEIPAPLFDIAQADKLKFITEVYFSDFDRQCYLNYKPISELQVWGKLDSLDYSTLCKDGMRPIKGKPPYENFQDEDIREALKQNRFLFNWTMGLGKSFATSVIYEYLYVNKQVPKMLLLTSKIGTYNLKNELSKFCKHLEPEDIEVFPSAESLERFVEQEVTDAKGKKKIKKVKFRTIFDNPDICNKKVLIFSYGSWETLAKEYGDSTKTNRGNLHIPLDKFFQTEPKNWLLCLDECHYLSNVKSNRTRAISKYFRFFNYRYLFSATPADKYEKLYSLCRTLDPGLVFNLKYDDWIRKYNNLGTYFSAYAINKNGWYLGEIDKLNQELMKYSAKRNTKDVMDLPPQYVINLSSKMSEKQTELYKKLTNELVKTIISKGGSVERSSDSIIKECFTTVSSFISNPNLIGQSTNQELSDGIKTLCNAYNYNKDYSKLEVVDAVLEDEVGEKGNRGIVWYIHPLTKNSIIERYKGYDPVTISAEMSSEERDRALLEFKSNPKHKILIASQYILSTSVTLIECTFSVYLETTYAYETYLQSTGRIYRIGQKESVRLYHIWMEDTVDNLLRETLLKKKDLIDTLCNALARSFSVDSIKGLLLGNTLTV